MDDVLVFLKERGIRPSVYRVKILELLYHKTMEHPTADEIYCRLSNTLPTLSRTTVYNTLKLFVDNGILQSVNIDDGEQRFDSRMDEHVHFKCELCNRIYDLEGSVVLRESAEGFLIKHQLTVYYGVCKNCVQLNKGEFYDK